MKMKRTINKLYRCITNSLYTAIDGWSHVHTHTQRKTILFWFLYFWLTIVVKVNQNGKYSVIWSLMAVSVFVQPTALMRYSYN